MEEATHSTEIAVLPIYLFVIIIVVTIIKFHKNNNN